MLNILYSMQSFSFSQAINRQNALNASQTAVAVTALEGTLYMYFTHKVHSITSSVDDIK